MKLKILIILIITAVNQSFSQTPPTPPSVNSGTSNGITYTEAETNLSYAFSCVFDKQYFMEIKKIITDDFKGFKDSFLLKNEKFKVRIRLKKTELKMEYKSFSNEVSNEFQQLKNISNKILEL